MIKTLFIGCLSVSLAMGQCPLLLTEIQADPTPSRGLPEIEYLEVYVNSPEPLSLQGWSLLVNSTTSTLAVQEVKPYTYYVLVAESQRTRASWSAPTISLSRLTLPNTGATVTLRSPMGPCHSVTYDPTWGVRYLEGGYSLELANLAGACLGRSMWQSTASSTGGTPGSPSLAKPLPLPKVTAIVPDSTGWAIHFSQAMRQSAGDWKGESIQGTWIDQATFHVNQPPLLDTWQRGTLANWYDCADQPVSDTLVAWGWFSPPKPGEWKWNEVLVAPQAGSQGFVELKSEASVPRLWPGGSIRYQSASSTRVVVLDLPGRGQILAPQEVWAFTGQNPRWESLYQVGARIDSLADWVDLANSGGSLTILQRNGEILDHITYGPDWNHAVVSADQGRSWQRFQSNWSPTPTKWGLATPGWEPEAHALENSWFLEPPYASAQNKEALLSFSLPSPDFVLSAAIVDATGQVVYRYPQSDTWPQEGKVSWTFPALPGIRKHYFLHLSGFHPDGRLFKKWVPFIWEFD